MRSFNYQPAKIAVHKRNNLFDLLAFFKLFLRTNQLDETFSDLARREKGELKPRELSFEVSNDSSGTIVKYR